MKKVKIGRAIRVALFSCAVGVIAASVALLLCCTFVALSKAEQKWLVPLTILSSFAGGIVNAICYKKIFQPQPLLWRFVSGAGTEFLALCIGAISCLQLPSFGTGMILLFLSAGIGGLIGGIPFGRRR